MEVSKSLIENLSTFDTPTVCNAIEMFDLRPRCEGFTDGRIRSAFPEMPPAIGVAHTASFRSRSPSEGKDSYGCIEALFKRLEDSSLPAIVVCQDLDDPSCGATFGEVMCGIYKSLGAVALITSGAGRDLAQIRQLGFPVFLGATICSHAYCHAVELGAAVNIGGLEVENGELMHADPNGITKIPVEIAAELPDVAAEYLRCEALVTEACAKRAPAAELMARRREMIDGIARLRQRVSRRS
jgi:4-hydroxy-4-methyl-2-oxoglutarate aldolase